MSALVALSFSPLVAAAGTATAGATALVDGTHARRLRVPPLPERSTILASNGTVLARVYRTYDREDVPLSQIDRVTRLAVLAVEDHGFYVHGPVDVPSIVRSALADVQGGAALQGASTITEQLAKLEFTGSADTLGRKVAETKDAIRLEHTYTKNQILDLYLNDVYLGNGLYGVGTAAHFYFDTAPSHLTLDQGALLAGMISSPSYYDPILRPKISRVRRDQVLDRLRVLGWEPAATIRRAERAPIRLRPTPSSPGFEGYGRDPYWVRFVVQQFLSNPAFGPTRKARARLLYQGGVQVYSTLRPALEQDAYRAIAERMSGPGLPQSAVVSIDPPTGAIETMAVGNQPFGPRHQFNLAADGGRTAGSAFKAFTLAAALEAGIKPSKVYNGNSPKTIPNCGGGQTWTVANAEPGHGNYTLWQATAFSVNVVFAQVINQVGPERVAQVAHRMGITSPLTPVCPLTLGTSPVSPLEMTSGYATLADGGMRCAPFAISQVVSRTGRTIYRAKPRCVRAIPAWVAAEETAILQNVVKFGTGTAANLCPDCRPQAGKTGTGENFQDAWFMGYVPQLSTGVWVGYAGGEVPMREVPGYGAGFGGTLAAPIWRAYMFAALAGLPIEGFPAAPIPLRLPPPPKPRPSPSPSRGGSPLPQPSASGPAPSPPPSPSPSPSGAG